MGVQDERPASADGPDHGAEEHVEIINSRSNIDEEKSAPGSGDHPKPSLSNIKFLMVLIGFGMAFVGSQVQPLIFAAITPLVAIDLDASDDLVWYFCAPIVAIGVTAPFAGPLADLFGRKPITVGGLLISMVGMILCAATPNSAGYLAGQGLAGVGIAVQELMAISAIAEMVPTNKRGFYIALMVLSFLPFTPGTLYGSLIANTDWRYCGALIAIWNFLTVALIVVFYNPPPRPNLANTSRMQMLKKIEFAGGILMSAGLVVFLVGVNTGGQAYPWSSSRVIALLTVGGVLVISFLLYEAFLAPHPMFPKRLLRHLRAFVALMVVILMAGINYIPILFFWVMESVAVYNSDHIEAGIRTLPFGFCIFGGAIISAFLLSSFKNFVRTIMAVFCVIQVVAIGCMTIVDTHDIATVWAPLTLGLTAVGGVLIPNQIIITIISPDDLIGTATCLTVSLRAVGQVVGTSIFYNQFVSVLTKKAYNDVVPVAVAAGIYDGPTLEAMMPTLIAIPFKKYALSLPEMLTPENYELLHNATIKAFGEAFARVYFISIAFGVVAVIASLCIGDVSSLIDEHIAVSYF